MILRTDTRTLRIRGLPRKEARAWERELNAWLNPVRNASLASLREVLTEAAQRCEQAWAGDHFVRTSEQAAVLAAATTALAKIPASKWTKFSCPACRQTPPARQQHLQLFRRKW